MPNWRSRTIVSPDTMNSSMRTIHGPIASRPAAASRAERGRGFGPDLEVVVEHRGLPVEQERAYDRSDSSIGSSASSSLTSRSRNVWNGEYHSRSQCVCGTIATRRHDFDASLTADAAARPGQSGLSSPAIQR